MKYFIKIDKKTIKRNKNAFSTHTTILDKKEIRFECVKMPKFLKDKENCVIIEGYYGNDGTTSFSGYLLDHKLVSKLSKIKDFNMIFEQTYVDIMHHPISEFSFSYKNKVVKCDYCKAKINTKDLIDIDLEDYYSPYGCPKCGKGDCVELEYESIKSVC